MSARETTTTQSPLDKEIATPQSPLDKETATPQPSLDQEIASTMKYLLEATNNPNPYYYNIPEDFLTPAIFFPQPEITTRGDTLNTYTFEFSWFVKFFDTTTGKAHMLAAMALTALQYNHLTIPLIDFSGTPTGRGFRMNDPRLRTVDEGAVQLTLTWDSPRPYHNPIVPKMMTYNANMWVKSAYDSAVLATLRASEVCETEQEAGHEQ